MLSKYFPGSNTGLGFYNLFNSIVPCWDLPHYTYVLKGGPGVGKNTLMKKIAHSAVDLGYDIELFNCASDPDSLDAIRIPKKRIVVVDGTAPHIVDPKFPGSLDEIIDLGHFKNQQEFYELNPQIKSLFLENSYHYSIAYSYLRCARELKMAVLNATKDALNIKLTKNWIREKFKLNAPCDSCFETRKLFTKAITPDGVVNFIDYNSTNSNVIKINGVCAEAVLSLAGEMVAGQKAEIFYSPITAITPVHIDLLDLGVALTVDKTDCAYDIDGEEFISEPVADFVNFNLKQIEVFVEKAVEQLEMSKEIHDEIEKFYRPFVDYDKVNKMSDELIKRINL